MNKINLVSINPKGPCRCTHNKSAHKYVKLWSGDYEINECRICSCKQYNHFNNLEYLEAKYDKIL